METETQHFHKLYGVRKTRMTYLKRDFLDYVLMIAICACVIFFAYGRNSVMTGIGLALCVISVGTFVIRHGVEFRMPVALRRPQDFLYLFLYKIQNMKPMYFFAVAMLLLQSYLIHLTPALPHHVELMRTIATYLFYVHVIVITLYRTASLVDHLIKKDLVNEVMMESLWKNSAVDKTHVVGEILHAYFTGLLTHLILIAPWYLVIAHLNFSLVFLPALFVINFATHVVYLKRYNEWFYRDHWLGHNSEVEFVYLHGSHHDTIPSGLIGVSGNGYLEGLLRHTLGHPVPFYNPVLAFLFYTLEVQQDILNHQYVPGVFPKMSRVFHEKFQHSTHHLGRLEPYSVALRSVPSGAADPSRKRFKLIPDEIENSIGLDERLDGFKWDNAVHRRFLALFDKYQGDDKSAPNRSEPAEG